MGTRVQAYDVHGHIPTGSLHFQVLVPVESKKGFDEVKGIVDKTMKSLNNDYEITSIAKTASDQGAVAEQEKDIEKDGYCIYKVYGFPTS